MGKSAGSQVCGDNECLFYLLQTTFSSCTCTGEMGEPFQHAMELREWIGLLIVEWGLVK